MGKDVKNFHWDPLKKDEKKQEEKKETKSTIISNQMVIKNIFNGPVTLTMYNK